MHLTVYTLWNVECDEMKQPEDRRDTKNHSVKNKAVQSHSFYEL